MKKLLTFTKDKVRFTITWKTRKGRTVPLKDKNVCRSMSVNEINILIHAKYGKQKMEPKFDETQQSNDRFRESTQLGNDTDQVSTWSELLSK